MRLYTVRVVNEFVVWADSDDSAKAVALKTERDERDQRQFAGAEVIGQIIEPKGMPQGWDTGCIPWGREDDVTIGEILGVPAGTFIRAAKDQPE